MKRKVNLNRSRHGRVPECHGVSEIHIVATVKSGTVKRVARGLYKFQMRLPKYVTEGFGTYKSHIKFIFYKSKTDTEPYMVCQYGHGGWILENDLAWFVVRKLDIDDRNLCEEPGPNWQSYGLPAKFCLQDYSKYGFRECEGLFNLHANEIQDLLREIVQVQSYKKGLAPAYMYCHEEIDRLEQLYKENIVKFVEAARFKGVKQIYIGHSRMYIDSALPTLTKGFCGWLSAFTGLLGSGWGNASEGLQGGSGNSQSLQYYNLHEIFPPEYYGKYYSISMHNDELKEIHFPERMVKTATYHDWKPNDNLQVYNIIRKEWEHAMANQYMQKPKVPEESLKLYEEYLELREKFFKKAGKYLYQQGYHVIESKWNSRYEVMIFANADYSKTCRIRLDENSNQIPGPWVNPLKDIAFVDIHSEDPAIKSWLEGLIVKNEISYIEEMSKMLDEVRYIAMSEKTMARLHGKG